MSSPISVLPNSNVLMSNGNVIDARMINSASKNSMFQPDAVPSVVSNGTVVMSNGATVASHVLNSLPSVNESPAMAQHVAAVTSNLAQSAAGAAGASPMEKQQAHMAAAIASRKAMAVFRNLGDVISANEHMALAQRHLDIASSQMSGGRGRFEGFETASANQAGGECPIAPPQQQRNYCRPAPFTSMQGQPYFLVGEAYGQAS